MKILDAKFCIEKIPECIAKIAEINKWEREHIQIDEDGKVYHRGVAVFSLVTVKKK